MAILKDIKTVSSAFSTVVVAGANVITSMANGAVSTVNNSSESLANLTQVAVIESNDLILDSKARAEEASIKRDLRLKGIRSIKGNKEVMAEVEELSADNFLSELREDFAE